jgi:RNA polymerase sigma-70 factor (ECF subfamily)
VPGADELPGRLHGVLRVIYLIFNEGYAAAMGDQLVRAELCQEAIRLGQLLCELMPGEPEVWGLQALMLLHDARRAARVDARGAFVALGNQDRSLWDEARLDQGLRALGRALRLRRPGEYQLQAAITALHVQPGGTDTAGWAQVAELYGTLAELSPSPVVEVNRATAAGFAYGPEAGLRLLGPLLAAAALQTYQPLHAAHAELLRRAGRRADAIDAYRRAIALSGNGVERAELERRLRALTAG